MYEVKHLCIKCMDTNCINCATKTTICNTCREGYTFGYKNYCVPVPKPCP